MWVSFFLYLWVSASLTEGWSPALNIRSYSRSRALIRDSPRSRSRSYDFISISIRRSSATSSDPQSQNPPSSQEESRISILRKGSTQIGPSDRPVTIFPGDYCVHRDLGIARFVDCVVDERWPMISVIRLAFGNNAEYIVDPVDREKISRLKSSDAAKPPKLTPLTEKGRAAWKTRVAWASALRRGRASGDHSVDDHLRASKVSLKNDLRAASPSRAPRSAAAPYRARAYAVHILNEP